jgi:PAT family acetyl-CoA transporter-like MFS transporter 1
MAFFVYLTPFFQNYNKTFPWYYYALITLIFAIQQVFVYSMFVSQMAFFAHVSDPKIGGTYMTLLNTLTNLGKIIFFFVNYNINNLNI